MKNKIAKVLSVVVAIMLLQTLFFKFTGAPESVAIFSRLGVEPWGRILTGVIELIGAVLIIIPKTTIFGSVVVSVVMIGALLSHVFVLGFAGGNLTLALMAIFILVSSVYILKVNKSNNISNV